MGVLVLLGAYGGMAVGLGLELVSGGLSLIPDAERGEVFYAQPKTGLVHDRAYLSTSQFDWHREQVMPSGLRLEDTYVFFLTLLVWWEVLVGLVGWLSIAYRLFTSTTLGLSPTHIAVGRVFLDRLALATLGLALALVGLTWRAEAAAARSLS